MLSPLCDSHSRQAATHERHPMQREGSRKILLTISDISRLYSVNIYRKVGVGLLFAIGSSWRRFRAAASAAALSSFAHSGACAARVAAQAHTLYSGILSIGSNTGLVSWLTACLCP